MTTASTAYHEVNLRDYFYVLRKRRLSIMVFFCLVMGLAVFLTYRATVLYRATVTVLIERQNPNIVDFKEVMAFDASTTEYYQTQYQMFKSQTLIERLIREEGLDQDPYFMGLQKGGLRRLLTKKKMLPAWMKPFLDERSLSEIFTRRAVKIDPVRNSRLVYLSIVHPDPERAAKIANSLISIYIAKNLEDRFLISTQAAHLLTTQLEELKYKVAVAEKKLQDYKEEHGLVNIPSVRQKNQFIQDAKLELVKIQAEESKIAMRYLPEHPKRIHIRSQIEGLKQKIAEEEKKDLELSRVAIDYSELEREAETARKIYESLLGRLEEMHSEAKTQASNVLVVDPAVIPKRPASPRPFLNFLVAAFMGLFGGVILAFFFEYLDSTIKIPDDIEKGLGLDLFGIVPHSPKDKNGPLHGEIFFSSGKPSQAAESFRAIRTTLLFRLRQVRGCKTVLVTSPNPGEGKSTTSLNLAVAFSQNHLKVLIVDADLRKPKLHERLEIRPDRGLTDVLEAQVPVEQAIVKDVSGLGFDFMACGSPSHHPTELLGLGTMKNFLSEMSQIYDVIILDTPPFLAVADTVVLSEFVDCMVVLARYHQTDKRHLRDLKRRFGHMSQKPFGIIINQVSVREKDYYYHQYYYYGYGEVPSKK